MEKHLDLLGRIVTDKVTNFTGVVTSVSVDLYGCVQVIATPQQTAKGDKNSDEKSRWLDVNRLEVKPGKRVMEPVPVRDDGRPIPGGAVKSLPASAR